MASGKVTRSQESMMKTIFMAGALIAGMTLPAIAETCENIGSRDSYNVSRNYTGAYASYASPLSISSLRCLL